MSKIITLKTIARTRWVSCCGACLCLLLGGTTVPTALAQEVPQCFKSILAEDLVWMTSGAAVQSGADAWVVDAGHDRILRVSPDGRIDVTLKLPGVRQIRAFGHDGYLVLRYSDAKPPEPELWYYDSNLRSPRQLPLAQAMAPDKVLAFWDFDTLGSGILGFGDVDGAEPRTGLFYVDVDGLRKQNFDLRYEPLDPMVINYTTDNTHRFVASIDNVGFVLVLEPQPWIGRVELGSNAVKRLPEFPADFRHFPQIAEAQQYDIAPDGGSRLSAYYNIVQAEKMTAGLYAGPDNYLYLLSKSAQDPEGNTAWWLIRVDPENGRSLAKVRLPTSTAAHLCVVPGEQDQGWMFFEKDPSKGFGSAGALLMPSRSLKLVPSSWIEQSMETMAGLPTDSPCDFLYPQ